LNRRFVTHFSALQLLQVWYRFVIQLGCVPLNGTSSRHHAQADLAVLSWQGEQQLSQQEMKDIGRLIGEQL
jgi:diketogulonate reductase-like aldo/keto reductase